MMPVKKLEYTPTAAAAAAATTTITTRLFTVAT